MKTTEEAEALLSRLTRGEKARLLQRVAQDLGDPYPGVDVIDDVCGGEPVIVRTRIPVMQASSFGRSTSTLLVRPGESMPRSIRRPPLRVASFA